MWNYRDIDVQSLESTKTWYDKIGEYDFNNPGFKSATGAFTQVVWKSTSKLGCGVTKTPDGKKAFITCHYCESSGNYMGQFPENVTKPLQGQIEAGVSEVEQPEPKVEQPEQKV